MIPFLPGRGLLILGAAGAGVAAVMFPTQARAAVRWLVGEGRPLPAGAGGWPKVTGTGPGRIRSGQPVPGPGDLVDVPPPLNRGAGKVHRLALAAYQAMHAEFSRALGASLGRAGGIVSAYRDPALQARLYAETVARMRAENPGASEAEITRLARQRRAPPGHSEHETGLAVDIDLDGAATLSKNANAALRRTPLYGWLAQNAGRFGFYEYAASGGDTGEAWHWVYNP